MSAQLRLSACLGLPVHDAAGHPAGRLADLEAEPGERFPRVRALLVRQHRTTRIVPWESVDRFGPAAIELRDGAELELAGATQLLLSRDVLDTQVVDLAGKRLARVGDIDLAIHENALRAVAVDVGLAPVARRLGLRRLAGRLHEDPIGWDDIYLASGPGHRVQLEHRAAEVHRLSHDELSALIEGLPPVRGAEVLDLVRPGVHDDPLAVARRAGHPRRRFRVMRARKRAPS